MSFLYLQIFAVPWFGSEKQTLLNLITQKKKSKTKQNKKTLQDHFKYVAASSTRWSVVIVSEDFQTESVDYISPMLGRAFKDFGQLQKSKSEAPVGQLLTV